MDKKNEPDYIKRMHEELDMLCLRIEKLKAFYNTRYMRRLPEFTCYLLKKQLKQMKAYRETLKLRIKYEESEAKEHEDASH
ncbi:crAss001_48 related protein [Limosilactobacillus vaginalis]|uniref:crAss001_48 related protein n=1 Tax=Limosilactobacillus vaginalis TaxID=1633 RepID=UPI001F0918BE|nr:hypothetical protein [Limosilactobacillus vaginalis]